MIQVKRVYNFSAGPSMLPMPVMERASAEMMSWGDSGMSVMEMSHRSPEFDQIITEAEERFRRLLKVPENYKIMYLQGGASTQFAAVPLNLMKNGKADYVVTGQFSNKAYKEAQKFGDVKLIASSADRNHTYIPQIDRSMIRPDADYVHICLNNTVYGTKYNYIPDTGDIPLVADFSSCALSEPLDVSKFGVLYAGAQKNIAPAGLTIVIVREDLIGFAKENIPVMLDYKTLSESGSMYNTPPCYPIYIAKLVFEWIETEMGGLEGMKAHNLKKCKVLYDYLDSQDYYTAPAEKAFRSMMNVPFVTGNADLDKLFAKTADQNGFKNIKGHRSVGGMRASIYNAMPIEGVEKLVEFMKDFAVKNPK